MKFHCDCNCTGHDKLPELLRLAGNANLAINFWTPTNKEQHDRYQALRAALEEVREIL